MGVDADFAGILNEIIQFLESLCEIELPLKFQNAREKLLEKSRTKLSTISTLNNRESLSPGPYLEMNVGKLFPHREEIDIEEYVGVEEQPMNSLTTNQDYYESFQEFGQTIGDRNSKIKGSNRKSICLKKIDHPEEPEDKLLEIYKTFTPAMTMNKAFKFGPLDHKIERKSFGFVRGNIRSCWIGLVGNHLLIYTSEKDKQPPEICSIKGYMGRPASNTISKDNDHSKSAFEIFCPGNKTLQFIAKTPKEMEEWLAAISRTSLTVPDRDSGMYERSMDEKNDMEHPEEAGPMEDGYNDVGFLIPSPKRQDPVVILRTPSPFQETIKGNAVSRSNSDQKKDIATPPTLPIRLPRQLPSLPNEEALIPSYEPLDDGYEEDDIYHKIDDFRDNGRSYENVKKKIIKRGKEKKSAKKKEEKKKKKTEEIPEPENYDDVDNQKVESKKEETRKKQKKSLSQDSPNEESEILETYDDVQAISQEKQIPVIIISKSSRRDLSESFEASEKRFRTSLNYDDILEPSSINSVESNTKIDNCQSSESKNSPVSSPTKSLTKSPPKRWFFVGNKKESPKKEEKKKENSHRCDKKPKKKKKSKGNAEATPQTSGTSVELELPTYDDISAYQNDLNSLNANQTENIDSNYNSPPKPRPIYVKPPNPILVSSVKTSGEIVNNVTNYRDINAEKSTKCEESGNFFIAKDSGELKNVGTGKKSDCLNDNVANCSTRISPIIDEEMKDNDVKISVDTEHYQIPRNDSVKIKSSAILADEKEEEQLYDDIAILAEFRSKQRNSVSFSHDIPSFSPNEKPTISIKKPWNRFGHGRKLSAREITIAQPTTVKNKSCPHLDQASDSNIEKTDESKLNKFQKLINKMENTLGKQPSGKSGISISNKTLDSE